MTRVSRPMASRVPRRVAVALAAVFLTVLVGACSLPAAAFEVRSEPAGAPGGIGGAADVLPPPDGIDGSWTVTLGRPIDVHNPTDPRPIDPECLVGGLEGARVEIDGATATLTAPDLAEMPATVMGGPAEVIVPGAVGIIAQGDGLAERITFALQLLEPGRMEGTADDHAGSNCMISVVLTQIGRGTAETGDTAAAATEVGAFACPSLDVLSQALGTPVAPDPTGTEPCRFALDVNGHAFTIVLSYAAEPDLAGCFMPYQPGPLGEFQDLCGTAHAQVVQAWNPWGQGWLYLSLQSDAFGSIDDHIAVGTAVLQALASDLRPPPVGATGSWVAASSAV